MQGKSCTVISPSSALWDQQTLFLILAEGETSRGVAQAWAPLVDEGWTLVVPQWSSVDELRAHLEECRTVRGLDPSRLIVAGIRQGAGPALELAAEAGRPWLCVAPRLPADFDFTPLTAVAQHTRGVVIHADDDAAAARLVAMLGAAGVTVVGMPMREPLALIALEALKALPLE